MQEGACYLYYLEGVNDPTVHEHRMGKCIFIHWNTMQQQMSKLAYNNIFESYKPCIKVKKTRHTRMHTEWFH